MEWVETLMVSLLALKSCMCAMMPRLMILPGHMVSLKGAKTKLPICISANDIKCSVKV